MALETECADGFLQETLESYGVLSLISLKFFDSRKVFPGYAETLGEGGLYNKSNAPIFVMNCGLRRSKMAPEMDRFFLNKTENCELLPY